MRTQRIGERRSDARIWQHIVVRQSRGDVHGAYTCTGVDCPTAQGFA
ncbi:hypothetical protein [Bifidobacterium aesculapii]|nr:hypothetical protein [Bifidobacterium aesculapii]